jgi:hypothetical protein
VRFTELRHWLRRVRLWLSDNRDLCVSLSSVVIAAGALFLSTYQGCVTRRHDRLMVQPRLEISFDIRTDGIGWTLVNEGLGPARIRGFKVFVNGVPQPPTEYFPRVFKGLGLPSPPNAGLRYTNIHASEYIPSGSGDWYLKPLLMVSPGIVADALVAISNHVGWQICYCSAYDECWLLKNRTTGRDDTCSAFGHDPKSIWWQG